MKFLTTILTVAAAMVIHVAANAYPLCACHDLVNNERKDPNNAVTRAACEEKYPKTLIYDDHDDDDKIKGDDLPKYNVTAFPFGQIMYCAVLKIGGLNNFGGNLGLSEMTTACTQAAPEGTFVEPKCHKAIAYPKPKDAILNL